MGYTLIVAGLYTILTIHVLYLSILIIYIIMRKKKRQCIYATYQIVPLKISSNGAISYSKENITAKQSLVNNNVIILIICCRSHNLRCSLRVHAWYVWGRKVRESWSRDTRVRVKVGHLKWFSPTLRRQQLCVCLICYMPVSSIMCLWPFFVLYLNISLSSWILYIYF